MKATFAFLLASLLTLPVPGISLACASHESSCYRAEGGHFTVSKLMAEPHAIIPPKEFFGTPISATYGYYDFADQARESYLPLQVFFNDPMDKIAKICDASDRDTVFIIEKENAVLSSILFGLIASRSNRILLLQYECVDLSLASGRYSASFAVIKNIFVNVSNGQDMGR